MIPMIDVEAQLPISVVLGETEVNGCIPFDDNRDSIVLSMLPFLIQS